MKFFIILFSLFFYSVASFANLYLQTDYQEAKLPRVVSKHHIFLEKRYTINYEKKSYILILKKLTNNEATIETESYNFDKKMRRTMVGGSYGTYRVGKAFTITDHAPNGTKTFELKILLEKIVATKP